MFSKPLAFGILALGCVTAAASGAYLATRHNAAEVRSAPAAAIATPTPAPAVPVADQGVRETEAAVSPSPSPTVAKADSAQDAHKSVADTRRTPSGRSSTSRPREQKLPERSARVEVARTEPVRTVPLPERGAGPVASSVPSAEPARPASAAVMPSAGSDAAHSETVETPRPPQFEELVLPAASVIGLQLETGLTSERAHIEDRVEARVTRDVLVDGRLAIPAGSRILGSVTQVDRGGKLKERARLAIRFHTLVMGNGDEVALRTEPITREGEAPAADSSKKIGGAAVGGAILGAILGGGKGAMIGGMAGAGGGTAMVMAGDRNPATFQPGTIVTARLAAPVTIQARREQ